MLGMWNAARLLALARQLPLLQRLEVMPTPLLQIGLAFVWTLLLWSTAVALWQKWPSARTGAPLVLTVYAVSNLSLTIVYAHPSVAGWLMSALAYATAVLFVRWGVTRASAQQYFATHSKP